MLLNFLLLFIPEGKTVVNRLVKRAFPAWGHLVLLFALKGEIKEKPGAAADVVFHTDKTTVLFHSMSSPQFQS